MKPEELSRLTDQELLAEAQKMKSSALTHAVLIGFLIGIIVFSVAVHSVGFLTLIPLFLIYKFIGRSEDKERNEALRQVLKERNLE